MQNLDAFTRDCFHAILRNRQAPHLPNPDPVARHLETRDEIDRMIGRALAAGIDRADVYAATFAIVSLADAVSSKDKGPLGTYWRGHMLVAHYFADSHTQAGFFERLDEARHTHRLDVLRVYASCLALGYRGQLNAAEAERVFGALQAFVSPGEWVKGNAPILPQPRLRKRLHPFWLPLAALIVSLALYTIMSSSVRNRTALLTGVIEAQVQGSDR